MDTDSKDFKNIPYEIQHEMLLEIRDIRDRRRTRYDPMPSFSDVKLRDLIETRWSSNLTLSASLNSAIVDSSEAFFFIARSTPRIFFDKSCLAMSPAKAQKSLEVFPYLVISKIFSLLQFSAFFQLWARLASRLAARSKRKFENKNKTVIWVNSAP